MRELCGKDDVYWAQFEIISAAIAVVKQTNRNTGYTCPDAMERLQDAVNVLEAL